MIQTLTGNRDLRNERPEPHRRRSLVAVVFRIRRRDEARRSR
jgi:hypothetical protein